MKRFIQNIALFIVPILLIIAVLPVDNRLKYKGLKDDCFDHGIWIYDRIHHNKEEIDIAFLGSSHTINGINDSLISSQINPSKAVNFGYCRLGRNFSYALLQEILTQKKVRHLILEVREFEDRYSHPIFPFIGNSSDVLFANPFFNRDLFSDIWTHLAYKTELIQDYIYNPNNSENIRHEAYGFASSSDTAKTDLWSEIIPKQKKAAIKLTTIEQNFHANFARVYLRKVSELCKKNQVKLTFLYIPSFGMILDKPSEYTTYEQYGAVLIPPKNIFTNPYNWFDKNHLNQTGAEQLSLWVAKQL